MIYASRFYFCTVFALTDKAPFLLLPVTFLSSFNNFMLIYFLEIKFFIRIRHILLVSNVHKMLHWQK